MIINTDESYETARPQDRKTARPQDLKTVENVHK
jgi:hypothetical protein